MNMSTCESKLCSAWNRSRIECSILMKTVACVNADPRVQAGWTVHASLSSPPPNTPHHATTPTPTPCLTTSSNYSFYQRNVLCCSGRAETRPACAPHGPAVHRPPKPNGGEGVTKRGSEEGAAGRGIKIATTTSTLRGTQRLPPPARCALYPHTKGAPTGAGGRGCNRRPCACILVLF